MSINNETGLKFLLYLLNKNKSLNSLPDKIANLSPEDWEILLKQAKQRDLSLLLYDHLHSIEDFEVVPQAVIRQLYNIYLAASARNAVMLHHAGKILQALRNNNIQVIVLKGLYLIESIYKSIGLRTFVDLDILVHKDDIPLSLSIMQSMGFTLSTYFDPAVLLTDIKHVPPLIKENGPCVEVHWGILEENEPFNINIDGIWQRAVPVRSADIDTLAMCTEDLILHLCLHYTYQHRLRAGLKFLFDIAEVITLRADQINWHKLISTAKDWKVERVLRLSLQLCERITGVQVLDEVKTTLQNIAVDESLLDTALRQTLTLGIEHVNMTPDVVAFTNAPGVIGKLKRLLQRVFVSRIVLARIYNQNPKSPVIFLYYFVRFYDLYRIYASSSWRLLHGEKSMRKSFQLEQDSLSLRDWMIEN